MQQSKFSPAQFTDAYSDGVENHFWNVARNRLVARTLRRALPYSGRILEIGCGRGVVLNYLRQQGLDCWGCELGAPQVSQELRRYVFTEMDFRDIDLAFRRQIQALLLLDVLEHIAEDVEFLGSIVASFPAARFIILTVPARAELWSNYDDHFGHRRRYNRGTLARAIQIGGFQLVHQRYFFHELYLPALIACRLRGRRDTEIRPPAWPALHRCIATLSDICSTLLPTGLVGTSLLALATPQKDAVD